MTIGIDLVFDYLPKILDRGKVFQGCRDQSKCAECAFNVNDKIWNEGDAPYPVSHGICPDCAEKVRAEINETKKHQDERRI